MPRARCASSSCACASSSGCARQDGKELIPETELLQQRDISFNESAVLAKEAEEALLYRDMQTDIVQQLMRRLAAVKEI